MKHDPRSDLEGFCAVGGSENKSGRPDHCFDVKETLYPARERAIHALRVLLSVYVGLKGKEARASKADAFDRTRMPKIPSSL